MKAKASKLAREGLEKPKVSEIVTKRSILKKVVDANELTVCFEEDELGSIQWS